MNNKEIKYFYLIDFLRWVAALAILLHHYMAHFSVNELETLKYLNFFAHNAILGSYGVWFFWVISGFVFSNIYFIKSVNFKDFFIKRFARLYPLHIFSLFVVLILQLILYYQFSEFENFNNPGYQIDLNHFILNLLFINDGNSYNGVLWSVSIEIPVYFFFFYFSQKFKSTNTIILFLQIFFVIFLFKILLHTNLLYYHLKACVFYFFIGVLVYFLYVKILSKYNLFTLISSIFFIILSIILFSLEDKFKLSYIKDLIPTTIIFFIAVIFFAISLEKYFGVNIKKISILGHSSYGLYLLHVPIQLVFIIILKNDFISEDLFKQGEFFIIFFILNIVTSSIVFLIFERPIQLKITKYLTNFFSN